MNLELIQSVNAIIPSKGTNAGKQMFVINGKYWSKTEPAKTDTHVCLEDVEVGENTYTNVVGFSQDSRMSINDKISLLKSNPEIANAIATLLR
jgi:hypothetical protein